MNAETVNMVGMMVAAPLHGSDTASASAAEMASKKIRKPYTITKCRESWTEQEHDKFFEALQLFDRDWKKIEAFVGSKTVIQIRSHAQKYFLKVQKNGTGEHLPPPRPKRKSAQPYPQKAAKAETICSAPMAQQVSRVTATPASQSDPLQILRAQPCTVFVPTTSTSTVSAWVHHAAPPVNCAYMAKGIPAVDFGAINMIPDKEFDSGSGKSPGCWSQQVPSSSEGNQETCIRATPNFAEVYSFIGNVFDPSTCDHLKMLKEMAPIDRETVILLMRNLSINLSSPTFEEHKLFLSVYDMGLIDTKLGVGSGTEEQMGGPCGAPLSSPVC